jgi:hypothetical protein
MNSLSCGIMLMVARAVRNTFVRCLTELAFNFLAHALWPFLKGERNKTKYIATTLFSCSMPLFSVQFHLVEVDTAYVAE